MGFLGALVAVFYTDNLGRRGMMLSTLPIIAGSMITISLSMYFIYNLKWLVVGQYLAIVSVCIFLFSFQLGMSS